MKRIKDFISIDNGIFTVMQETQPDKYKELFEDLSPTYLDYDFFNMSSERYASPIVSNCVSIETIVNILLNHFYKNWIKVKNTLTEDYDTTSPYYKTTTRETESNQKSENESENVTKTDIYAFNSSEESDKDKVLTNNLNNGNIDNSETVVETVKGNNGNTLQSEMIEKELVLRKNSFINIVLSDTKELLTLSIY